MCAFDINKRLLTYLQYVITYTYRGCFYDRSEGEYISHRWEEVAARRSVSPCCGTLVDLAIIFAIYAIKILDRVDGVKLFYES